MRARLIQITTALAVLVVASVAAIISYRPAYELVAPHGETGPCLRSSYTAEASAGSVRQMSASGTGHA